MDGLHIVDIIHEYFIKIEKELENKIFKVYSVKFYQFSWTHRQIPFFLNWKSILREILRVLSSMKYGVHINTWFLKKRNWIEPLTIPFFFLWQFYTKWLFPLSPENLILIVWQLCCLEPVLLGCREAEQVLSHPAEERGLLHIQYVCFKDMW